MNTQFAVNEYNRLVHISEVVRGLACQCKCEVCGHPLIARKGSEREHHFAHAPDTEACVTSYESQLHRFAKEAIQDSRGLRVPPIPTTEAYRPVIENGSWLTFDRVEAEVQLEGVRPDIIGYRGHERILIEVAYSSFADASKIAKLKEKDVPTVEIDLRRFTPDHFDRQAVKEAVVQELEFKVWLNWIHVPPASVPTSAPPMQKERLPEEIVTINGMWVSVRYLPYGDAALKVVSFNPEVNAIVKAIAKRYFGRWNQTFKNWIVPSRWVSHAVTDLKVIAEAPVPALP